MTRTEAIDLLEAYSLFLEEQGYTDTDWRTEPPFAIDRFLSQKQFKKLQIKTRLRKHGGKDK